MAIRDHVVWTMKLMMKNIYEATGLDVIVHNNDSDRAFIGMACSID